jgi:hypothetical protein
LQAIDYLECQSRLSPFTRQVYTELRMMFPKFVEDLPKYEELRNLSDHFEKTEPAIPFYASA